MALTRPFAETVRARALRDPAFRAGFLQEALEALRGGDLETAKLLLRDYANVGLASTGRRRV